MSSLLILKPHHLHIVDPQLKFTRSGNMSLSICSWLLVSAAPLAWSMGIVVQKDATITAAPRVIKRDDPIGTRTDFVGYYLGDDQVCKFSDMNILLACPADKPIRQKTRQNTALVARQRPPAVSSVAAGRMTANFRLDAPAIPSSWKCKKPVR